MCEYLVPLGLLAFFVSYCALLIKVGGMWGRFWTSLWNMLGLKD